MGSHQENWFYNELTKSSERGATWRIIGNQIIFSSIVESYGLSGDNWNVSYCPRNRRRALDMMADRQRVILQTAIGR